MNIDYFTEFITLAKLLNFSAAAEILNMTQPGLSRHIAALEKELGVKLFHRDTHKIRLTEAGVLFFNGITKITEDYADLCRKVKRPGNKLLNIGILYYDWYIIEQYIGACINNYKNTTPDVNINYYFYKPDDLVFSLLSQKTDIIIIAFPCLPKSDKLGFQFIANEHSVLMLHKDHPLAQRATVCLDDIRDETQILIRGENIQIFERYFWEPAEKSFNVPDKFKIVESFDEGLINLYPTTNVMLAPDHLKPITLMPDIKKIDIPNPECLWHVCMVYYKNSDNPLVGEFVSYYREHKLP
jgi:DNA-binding transcriptional LysR family regulator